MSAGYGYFRIEFYTGDGSEDSSVAKNAYDYCKANYDWFNGENGDGSDIPFLLSGNSFVPNDSWYADGLDIKNTSIPSDVDWLEDAAKEANAARLVASVQEDYSESSDWSNSYTEKVWIDGKVKDKYKVYEFNNSTFPPYERDSGSAVFHLDDGTYRHLCGMFKNAKTGEIVLCGQLISHLSDDDESIEDTNLVFYESGEEVSVNIDDLDFIDKEECVRAFISEVKEFMSEECEIDESDWTFEGFKGDRRSFFEIYGSKEPTEPFMDCEDYARKLDDEIESRE